MLLVATYDPQTSKSTIAVWDFLEGRRDYFCKSVVPFEVIEALWNPYLENSMDEFVTFSAKNYNYWRITKTLQMQYQAGKMPESYSGTITCCTFVEPMAQ